MFFCTTDSESFSKADILRGIITEKLSIATRDILAVVERTVADYEEEASGFRRRIARQERQLELLQPRVRLRRPLLEPEPRGYEELAVQEPPKEELLPPPRVGTKKKKTVFLGVEDSVRLHFPKKNDDEDDDDGAGAFDDEASDEEEQLAEQVQPSASSREKSKDPDFELPRRPQRRPVRPSSSPTHLNLRIRFIKDPNVDVLHSSVFKDTIVRDLSFPQSLQESDFVDLLRSSFPPLAESDKDFEIHTLNQSKRLIKLQLKTMAPREIIRSMKSNARQATVLFIKLKRPEAEKKSEETSEEKLKGASEEIKEKSEEEKEEKPEEDNEEMEDSHVSTVEDTPSSTDAVPEEEDVAGPSSRPQRHPVRPIRYWTSSSPTHLNLRIRFIKDPNVDMLHSSVLQNTIVRDLSFPQSLQESEFVDLIRSSFPPLAESDKDFEIHTLNGSQRLIKLPLKTMSPREIVRSMKSNAPRATVLFIKLKRPEAEKKSEETSEEKLKGTSEEIKEKSEEEKEEKPEEDNEEMEDSHVSTVEDTPSSTDAVPEEEDVAGPSSSSGPHGFSEKAGSRDSPEPQRDSELDDVDQDDAEDPEWKLESKQQKEVKKTADKTSKSLGGRWEKRACKVCGCWYKSLGSLIKHTWTHMDERQTVCGVCGDNFESPEELKEHLSTYDKVHKCEECGKTFVKIDIFKRHLDLHSRKVDIQCDVCGKTFGTKSGLSVHSWSHTEERPYKCDICDKAFGLKSLLKAHRKNHNKNQCHICGKTLSSTRGLSWHLMSHSEKRNFACDVCGKRFKIPSTLRIHKKIHMERERSFLCHICCKTFHCNTMLNIHMTTHSSEKPFVCQDCGKGFTMKSKLKFHQRVHSEERPHSCSHCGRCFKLKSTLKIHINTHLGIKRFTCTLCGKTASRPEHLKIHMRTHNGERPYKCSLCDKAFTQSHCLKTHMRKFHPGENPSQNPTGP
ncbi:zinc finger and SCAN domain-containing protein 2 isoform X4 [Oryzias latipes]|uniref:zinc finger and SCAN domain-containing protein 2 isoform X4 n=1 Tax=Oryzias latipes TaxID=8090 RepID=UPI000CE1E359|nr:zinc finger and SCAN domain-containing protein 2 isoform X4 [Oryzias latipes]